MANANPKRQALPKKIVDSTNFISGIFASVVAKELELVC